jgi:hypothetical protein
VTYNTGYGFDDWIYCTLYIHTNLGIAGNIALPYSTHFRVHRYTRTRILRLH